MTRFVLMAVLPVCILLLSDTATADCMGPYPPSMVKAFDQNCAKDPTMMSFCSCLMDDVQKNIPLSDFIEIGNSPGGINNDPRFIKSSKKCSTLIPSSPNITTPSTSTNITTTSPAVNRPAGANLR